MTATSCGHPGAVGPTALFPGLQTAQEQQANLGPFPSLPTSGTDGTGGAERRVSRGPVVQQPTGV